MGEVSETFNGEPTRQGQLMIVRVEPSGSVIDVRHGQALWVSMCCDVAECVACVVEIIGAIADLLHAGHDKERDRPCTPPECRFRPDAVLRLACRFRPGTTDATVGKQGVRAAS
jgi:ferredoxin